MHAPELPRPRAARALAEHWRLNARYLRYCAIALVVSSLGHVLYLVYGPAPEARPYELRSLVMEVIDIPDVTEIPKPPREVPRPPLPQELTTTDDDAIEEDILPVTELRDLGEWRGRPERQEAVPFYAYERAPESIKRVRPDYPELARQAHAAGRVRVQVLVDRTGRVIEAVVVQSNTIASLEEAALRAARKWLFRPALQRDVAVPAYAVLTFDFSLR